MKINFMKEKFVMNLKFHLKQNEQKYFDVSPWINEYFKDESWSQETKTEFEKVNLIQGDDPKLDVDNAILLYESLKHLTPSQAADERIWSYLTHVVYWDYMRSRWNFEKAAKNKVQFLKNYYFFGETPFVNNGIARLWWSVYCTVDETKEGENKYELTRYLFTNQNLFREFFKRGFTRNSDLLKRILLILKESDWKPVRDEIFKLVIRLNREAGVIILDLLDEDELRYLIINIINENETDLQVDDEGSLIELLDNFSFEEDIDFSPEVPVNSDNQKQDLLVLLKNHNLQFVDKRNNGGALWVLGNEDIKDAMSIFKTYGFDFEFTPNGSKSTKRNPGWFLRNK